MRFFDFLIPIILISTVPIIFSFGFSVSPFTCDLLAAGTAAGLTDHKLYLGSFSGLTGSTGSTGTIGVGLTGVTGVFDHNSYLGLDCSAGTPFFGDLGISVMSGRG